MTLQGPVDRGYLNLLAHLRGDTSRVSVETVHAAICHYLIHPPPANPTPTPLTASVISSPLWGPLSLKTCLGLGSTFRISVRQKLSELSKKKRGLFDVSVSSDLASWLRGILAGLKDGDTLLRLSASGGILLGMNDLRDSKLSRRIFRDVEEMVLLAFAEAAEEASGNEWTSEFAHDKENLQDRVELSVFLASQYLNSISMEALSALNLLSLASSCLPVISKGFESGNYLHTARDELAFGVSGSIKITDESSLERDIDALLASDSFICMPYLCRLLARVVDILAEKSVRTRKRTDLWELLDNIVRKVYFLSCQVEGDWRSSTLADVQSKIQLDERLQKLTENIWTVLKTHLFSSLMLQQAVLDTILFHSLPASSASSGLCLSSYLTWTILKTLSSFSFIIASFGGVTSGTTEPEKGPSFPELKKAFYTSIDILSTDLPGSDAFVRSLVRDAEVCNSAQSTNSDKSPFIHAKRYFVLACVEQFIPVLSDSCIEEYVVPFCEPHLGEPSNRQTYESAHSVMLSIFAAHAERSATVTSLQQATQDLKGKAVEEKAESNLARRLVPGYAQSLLGNAKEGGLTTPQLRLAYAALVRSASTGRNPNQASLTTRQVSGPSTPPQRNGSEVVDDFSGGPALAWLCVEQLLKGLSTSNTEAGQVYFALSLTLISLVPNVGLYLLPRVLEEVEHVVDAEADLGQKQVLIESVYEEILERVGDAEREVAMKWWFERSKKWEGSVGSRIPG